MTTLNLKVSASNLDCTQYEDGSNLSIAGTTQVAKSGTTAGVRRWAGIIFALAIPKGSTISSATIAGYLNSGASNNDLDSHVAIEDADDAAPFAVSDDLVNHRTFHGTEVAWDFLNGAAGYSETSPDLSALIQAVIDRAGWASGNRVCLAIKGDNATSQQCIWRTWDMNSDDSESFKLDVAFEPPSGIDIGAVEVAGQEATGSGGAAAALNASDPGAVGQALTGSAGAGLALDVGAAAVAGGKIGFNVRQVAAGALPVQGSGPVDVSARIVAVGSPRVSGQTVTAAAGARAGLEVGAVAVAGQAAGVYAGAKTVFKVGAAEVAGQPVRVSLQSPLDLVILQDGIAKIVALEIDALDSAGNPAPLRVSNAMGLSAEDPPSSVPFLNLLRQWDFDEVLGGEEDSIGGASAGNRFTATIADDRREEANLEPWDDATIKGRAITVWEGAELAADGSPFPWSAFEKGFVGFVTGIRKSGDTRQIECSTSPREERKVVRDTYRGFGRGVELVNASADDEFLSVGTGPDLAGSAYTLVVAFTIDSWLPGADGVLFAQANGPTVTVRSDGLWRVDHGTATAEANFGWLPPVGELNVAAIRWDPVAGTLALQAERHYEAVPYSDAVVADGGDVTIGGNWTGKVWEAWVASSDLGREVVSGLIGGAFLYDRLSYPTVRSVWKFETSVGTTVKDLGPDRNDLSVTWLSSERWVSSLAADDPLAHNTGLAGKTVQVASGYVFNVPVPIMDTKGSTYRWTEPVSATLGAERLTQVRVEGAPLQVPWPYNSLQILVFEAPDRVAWDVGDPASNFDGIGPFAGLIAEEDGRPGSTVVLDYDHEVQRFFDAAAVEDLGNGDVRIYASGHSFDPSDKIQIHGTDNYDTSDPGGFTTVTGADPGVSFDITAAYVAETFDGSEYGWVIKGSANNIGTFEVASVDDRGYAIRVVEQTIVDEASSPTLKDLEVFGVALETDATARTFTPLSAISGKPTADFVGRAPTSVLDQKVSAAYAWWRAVADRDEGTAIADVSPVAVTVQADVDEFWFQVGAAVLAGEDRDREELLGELLDSGFLWARDDRDGGITLGQYDKRTPTGQPIVADTVLDLDRLDDVPRAYDLTVLWSKNYSPGGASYPGSVPQSERFRLDEEWSRAQSVDPEILSNDKAARQLEWPTALSFDYSAARLLPLLSAVFGFPLEWWRLVLDMPGHQLLTGETRTIDHPTLGSSPVVFTITALKHTGVLRGSTAIGFLLR